MANMSYCRFENTYNDLRDCYWAIQEAGSIEDMDLSDSEKTHLFRLINLAQKIIDAAEEHGDFEKQASAEGW